MCKFKNDNKKINSNLLKNLLVLFCDNLPLLLFIILSLNLLDFFLSPLNIEFIFICLNLIKWVTFA